MMGQTNLKVMSIFGTRPEAIKMAPVVKELEKQTDIDSVVVVTAQHREMLDQVLEIFAIEPDYDLDVMTANQSLSVLTSRVLIALDDILLKEKPDVVLVHGDTTTSFVASLAAFYHGIKIGHVEAGLRTWDITAPFPEEANRQMTDVLADYYFAPTALSKANLLKSNVPEHKIYVTGNTVVDAIKQTTMTGFHHPVKEAFMEGTRKVLVTMHRRENFGQPMMDVFNTMVELVEIYPDLEFIYPVHPNPNVKRLAEEMLGQTERIHLIEPLDVLEFHNLMRDSYFMMSDSGGVQEEAPSVHRPVLILRDVTERPEGLESGILSLVGTDPVKIKSHVSRLLDDDKYYQRICQSDNPYGDGRASKYIVNALKTANK